MDYLDVRVQESPEAVAGGAGSNGLSERTHLGGREADVAGIEVAAFNLVRAVLLALFVARGVKYLLLRISEELSKRLG